VYTVHLEPMLEWESAATVITRQKKERLEARRVVERAAYAIKKGEAFVTTSLPESKEISDSVPPCNEADCASGESKHGVIET
jgi:hypothetical protein